MASNSLTPPDIAQEYGVNVSKVLQWIRSGELRAANLAARVGGRPRYRISAADLQAFIDARSAAAVSTPRQARRRRNAKPADFVRYFS